MINRPRFYKLRNSEFLQFLVDVLSLCNNIGIEAKKLTAVILALQKDTTEFDECFKLTAGSSISEELIELDSRRDYCIIGIRQCLVGYCNHFSPEIKKASEELLMSMDKYGKKIYNLNYPSETSTINSLLDDWKNNPHLAAGIAILKLEDWTKELQTANTIFNERYLLRVNEKASAPQVKAFTTRKKAIASFNNLVKHIEAHATLAEDQTYNGLINNLNTLISKYNAIADSHISKKETPKV